jgi:glycine cleavage system regulatory protein
VLATAIATNQCGFLDSSLSQLASRVAWTMLIALALSTGLEIAAQTVNLAAAS